MKTTPVPICDVHTISGGKVTEAHRDWDLNGASKQLGIKTMQAENSVGNPSKATTACMLR